MSSDPRRYYRRRYRQNCPSDRSSGTTAWLSGTARKLKFLKIVLAITFDSGLHFWCSSARFEATIKAFITIAEDPSSTTTKIRGQARSFYINGWRTSTKGITLPTFTPCHSFDSQIPLCLSCPIEASSWWLLGLCTFAPCSFRAKLHALVLDISCCWHKKEEVGVQKRKSQKRKDSKEKRSKKCKKRKKHHLPYLVGSAQARWTSCRWYILCKSCSPPINCNRASGSPSTCATWAHSLR